MVKIVERIDSQSVHLPVFSLKFIRSGQMHLITEGETISEGYLNLFEFLGLTRPSGQIAKSIGLVVPSDSKADSGRHRAGTGRRELLPEADWQSCWMETPRGQKCLPVLRQKESMK